MKVNRKPRQKIKAEETPNPINEFEKSNKDEVPNVLFAPDGRTFFPCKYCCRAFAHKRSLTTHLRICSFKVVEVSDSEDEDNSTKQASKRKVKTTKVEEDATAKKNGINILGNVVIKEKNSPVSPPKVENWVEVKDFMKNENNSEVKLKNGTTKKSLEVMENNPKPKIEDDTESRSGRLRIDQKTPRSIKQAHKTRKPTTNNTKRTPNTEQPKSVPETIITSLQNCESISLIPINKPKPNTKAQNVDVYKKVTCRACDKTFENSLDLFRHRREIHTHNKKVKLSPESLKIYDKVFQKSPKKICPLCNKPCTKVGWKRHLQTHSTEVKYFCRICKKGFNRIDHQREHEKRHVVTVAELQ